MAIAWIFPGQGSQYVGMGKDLADSEPLAAEALQTADEVLGFSLRLFASKARKRSWPAQRTPNRPSLR